LLDSKIKARRKALSTLQYDCEDERSIRKFNEPDDRFSVGKRMKHSKLLAICPATQQPAQVSLVAINRR
jgi:hypothetical protein